jgi:16S rRNA (uracil1498-N3)-methyltransferase
VRLVAHPGGKPLAQIAPTTTETCFAVGPEGGFTDDEIQLATDNGWQIVSLGPRILRIETAAVALLGALALRC